jgi:hypothetical protein
LFVPLELPPPQPSIPPITAMPNTAISIPTRQRRRGNPPTHSNAANTNPVDLKYPSRIALTAVVDTVRVLDVGEPCVICFWAGLREQVGCSVAGPWPLYVTAQVKFTVPVNPLTGEIWTVAVADPPGEAIVNVPGVETRATEAPPPVKLTVCVDVLALSVTVSEPVRVPAAVGVNVIAIVQLLPPATLVPQVLVSAKSPPVAIVLTARAVVLPFDKVTLCGALVEPTGWDVKVMLPGETAATGTAPLTTTGTALDVAVLKLLSPP